MSWPTMLLHEAVTFRSGGTPSKAESEFYGGETPWITGADIHGIDEISPRTQVTELALKRSKTGELLPGDVALVTRTSVGKVALPKQRTAFSQDITGLRPNPEIDDRYLARYLESRSGFLSAQARGATIKGVTRDVVGRLVLPVPPIEEQRRIAAILDRADTIRTKRQAAINRLAALSQALFQEMMGPPDSWRNRWEWKEIGDMASSVQYGTSSPAGAEGEWPVIRMGNITDDARLNLDDLKYMDLNDNDVTKFTVKSGDLLFNRTNSAEKVGKSCVIDTDKPMAFAGYLIRVRFSERATADLVAMFLSSPYGRALRLSMAKSAINQANINAREMSAIKMPVPPLERQEKFSKSLLEVRRRESSLNQALVHEAELFASLQAQAFRGEL